MVILELCWKSMYVREKQSDARQTANYGWNRLRNVVWWCSSSMCSGLTMSILARLKFPVHKLAINVVSSLLCHIITAGYPQLEPYPSCSSVDLQDRHSGPGIGECLLVACSCEPCRQFQVSDSGSRGFPGRAQRSWRKEPNFLENCSDRAHHGYCSRIRTLPVSSLHRLAFSNKLVQAYQVLKGSCLPKMNRLRYEDASILAGDAAVRDLVYHVLIMH